MKKYLLFFMTITLFTCTRDWNNPLEIDEDLKHTPKIVQIQTNSEYDIEIILDYGYSEESTIILERKTIGGFAQIPYRKLLQPILVDTSFNKESDHTFIYRIRVEKNEYRTAYSSEQTFQYAGILNTPGNLQARVIELQGVRLEWRDKSSKEEGYKIEKNEGSGYNELVRLPANSNSYLDAIGGIPPTPLQLSYRVKAYTNTQSSNWTEIATSYSGLGSPTNLRITDTTYYLFTIKWEDNSNIETGYVVERQKDNGGFDKITELDAGVTQYIDRITETGTYAYRVRAKKDNLYSISSNEVSHSIQNVMPMEGLVAFYPFDGNANDESGNGNDGTVYGATLTTDRFGNVNSAYSFDGVNDYVNVPDDNSLGLWNSYTLEAWIYQKESKSSRIIDKSTAGTPDGPHLDTHPGSKLRSCAGACVVADTDYTLNSWHHVVVTFDKGDVKFYLDGTQDGGGTVPSPLVGNDLPLRIGFCAGGPCTTEYFNGIIDDVRIYNRALTEDEIQTLYHEGGWGN